MPGGVSVVPVIWIVCTLVLLCLPVQWRVFQVGYTLCSMSRWIRHLWWFQLPPAECLIKVLLTSAALLFLNWCYLQELPWWAHICCLWPGMTDWTRLSDHLWPHEADPADEQQRSSLCHHSAFPVMLRDVYQTLQEVCKRIANSQSWEGLAPLFRQLEIIMIAGTWPS